MHDQEAGRNIYTLAKTYQGDKDPFKIISLNLPVSTQKQQQESAQNVDSILDRVTAEEKYYSTKTQAIKNGWMTKEEVVKLEHQIDSNITKNEKGIINGQVQEQSLTFQERVEMGNQFYAQKRTGTVKKNEEESTLNFY
ncbi:hypothetical protein ASE46_24755 [Bacillus sp. Root239]|nr:hypothetical protein ASE46_24755 [Bacillus sp. Root239]